MRPSRRAIPLAAAFAALSSAGCDVIFGIREATLRPAGAGGAGGAGNTEPVVVGGTIASDTTWPAGAPLELRTAAVVEPGATLTVEPGATVLAERGTLIAVKPGGRIVAAGTKDAPIVFTSGVATRQPGDWGGILLCGRARLNMADNVYEPSETPASLNLACGGPDDEDDSGVLQYVRIEFGGALVTRDNMASFALYGVGRRTVVDHVEVLRSGDDAVDMVGGTVGLKHILVVGAADDAVDWDNGWRGKAQFVGVLMTERTGYDNGIEGDDDLDPDGDATVISSPVLYNVTIVGQSVSDNQGVGVNLNSGTRVELHNALVTDFVDQGLNVDDDRTIANAARGLLEITHSIFANPSNFQQDADFDEAPWIMAPARKNRELPPGTLGLRSRSSTAPDLSLEPSSPALTGAVAPPDDGFFDPGATFVGACGATCPDFEGWTAFPAF